MKTKFVLIILLAGLIISSFRCTNGKASKRDRDVKIIFLHHSTGNIIYKGNEEQVNESPSSIQEWFNAYNNKNGTSYRIVEQAFPKNEPYGWNNYPYDYYNIWVKNGGPQPFTEEPTLEMLTKQYNVIIFKHCFPVSSILESEDKADINSSKKTLDNYKLQYNALKKKMKEFPDTKFIVWTGAALLESRTTPEKGKRSREFAEWVKNKWNSPKDNIFIWDFYELETEGGIYLKPEYAVSKSDSHPNADFAVKVLPLFGNRIIDVIENKGKETNLKGGFK